MKNMITKILRKVYFFDLSMLISIIVIDYDYYNVPAVTSRLLAAYSYSHVMRSTGAHNYFIP